MRVMNILLFLILGICVLLGVLPCRENEWWKKCRTWVRGNQHLIVVVLIANAISFAMTLSPSKTEIYVGKNGYGEEEQQIPFLLEKGEESTEISLLVRAKQLSEEELKRKVDEAFSYLKEHMKGENPSLSEVCTDLDYSLNQEEYPFDVEFVSADVSLIDREGKVHNDREDLASMGYTEKEWEKGISTEIEVTLWYGEEAFEETLAVVIFPRKETALEQQFQKVEDFLVETEKEASYEEGFVVPTSIEEITIRRMDEREITSGQVLLAGVVLAFLLVLREQENKRKKVEDRKNSLTRSYPWFVNEMVLLLGAGMQTRNIFGTLIREFEENSSEKSYRNPLIEELKISVRAMELGMSEEQAYYRLGRRLGLPCYIKLLTLLEQNIKRGGKGITDVFEQEEALALEERKNLAKKYGEEAGTKLLGPMILLLLVVMLMIMVPALWSFA